MTIINCIHCDKPVDTKKEKLVMTVNWMYKDLLKLNNIQSDKNPSKVIGICPVCWDNILKKKIDVKDWYWTYNQSI